MSFENDKFLPASKADLRFVSNALHDKINRLEWMLAFALILLMPLVGKLIFGLKFFWE